MTGWSWLWAALALANAVAYFVTDDLSHLVSMWACFILSKLSDA